MKEPMRQLYKVILLATVFILQACGSSEDNTVFSISADITEAKFSNEFLQESTDSIAIEVDFVGDGLLVGFAPDTTAVPWIQYRTENITENSATVYIDIVDAQFLLANTYETKLRLATSNDDYSKFAFHDIDISLIIWNLDVDKEKIKYNGTFGDDTIAAETLVLSNEDKEWTASTDVAWLSLDITAGVGDAEITITPDITGFIEPGLQQGNIIITDLVSGDSKQVPVELALDNVYLLAEQTAVALTSTNNISALEKTLTIGNSTDITIDWQASTTASWLTLTPINGHQLKISADPNIAPVNSSSLAQVIVSASSNSLVIDETITVNFYSSDVDTENQLLEGIETNSSEILASPLKPVFYLGSGNQLLVYHQYTGMLESSVTVSSEGTSIEQLIMHPNGDYILAKAIETIENDDQTTNETTHRYQVNLSDNSVTELVDTDLLNEPMSIIRLSGRYFVVTESLEFANENLQRIFWDSENAYFTNKVDVATQANTLFVLDNNSASFKRYIPYVNDFGEDRVSVTLTHEYSPELLANGQFIFDFMVTNDEANIYAISPASEWISFDGVNFVDNGLLEANENVSTLFVEKDNNNQPNYFRMDSTSELGFYLDVYDNNQAIASTTYIESTRPNKIKLSGDAQRLIVHADSADSSELNSQIELITIPQ